MGSSGGATPAATPAAARAYIPATIENLFTTGASEIRRKGLPFDHGGKRSKTPFGDRNLYNQTAGRPQAPWQSHSKNVKHAPQQMPVSVRRYQKEGVIGNSPLAIAIAAKGRRT